MKNWVFSFLLLVCYFNCYSQIPFEQNGKIGLKSSADSTVILKPKYAYISSFNNGYAIIKNKKGKAGIIDLSGKEILSTEYEDIKLPGEIYPNTGEIFFWVKKDGKWGGKSPQWELKTYFAEIQEVPFGMIGYLADNVRLHDSYFDKEKGWYDITGFRFGDYLSEEYSMPRYKISDNLWRINNVIYDSVGRSLYRNINSIDTLTPNSYLRFKFDVLNFYEPEKPVVYDIKSGKPISNYDKDRLVENDTIFDINASMDSLKIVSFTDEDDNKKFAIIRQNGPDYNPKRSFIVPLLKDSIKVEEIKFKGVAILGKITTKRDLSPYIAEITKGLGNDFIMITDANGSILYKRNPYKIRKDGVYEQIHMGNSFELTKMDGGWMVTENGQTFFMDDYGKRKNVKSWDFDEFKPYDNQYAFVRKDGKQGLVSIDSGDILIPLKYKSVMKGVGNQTGEYTVQDESGNIGFYSITKKKFTAPIGTFDKVEHNYALADGKQLLVISKNGKMGAYLDGKIIVPIKHVGYGGWNGENKIFFDDDNKDRTGTTFYVYTLDGRELSRQFFYNDQKRQYRQWRDRYYR